jgi:hypothetical protein
MSNKPSVKVGLWGELAGRYLRMFWFIKVEPTDKMLLSEKNAKTQIIEENCRIAPPYAPPLIRFRLSDTSGMVALEKSEWRSHKVQLWSSKPATKPSRPGSPCQSPAQGVVRSACPGRPLLAFVLVIML